MIQDLAGSEVPDAYADVLVKSSDAYFSKLYRAWKDTGTATPADLRRVFGDWKPL
jgi:hypothetical protein